MGVVERSALRAYVSVGILTPAQADTLPGGPRRSDDHGGRTVLTFAASECVGHERGGDRSRR